MGQHVPKRLLAGLAALIAAVLLIDVIFPPPLERAGGVSVLVTDRAGKPLRAFPTPDGRWRFDVDLDQIDPDFVDALIRVEDKRFWDHHGTDWLGLLRAAFDSAAAGQIVSGGSTLTMQTARMLEPRPRNAGSKLIEIWRANQLERRLSKREILELYLSLTPYGGNLEGVRAASWSYFGHEADRLSTDEIALLIALPQSPEVRRPDRRPAFAAHARDWVAEKLARYGVFSENDVLEVAASAIPARRLDFPDRAWHGADAVLASGPREDVRSTLDAALQAELERIAFTRAQLEGTDVQISAIVVHVPTRAVRALVGSASRERAGGWLDLTNRPRSPGSTLKPFIYALAFDDGTASADTRIQDLPSRFAGYQPENFDRMFHGDVRVSDALQHSLNVPAVLMLDRVGAERFSAQLAIAGARPRVSGARGQAAGLAIALGGAGLTARELAVLYSALGDGGVAKPLVWRAEEERASLADPGRRLMGEASAAEILRILQGSPSPEGRMPGQLTQDAPQIAFKTGTSYGYRDAWAAAVSGQHVIIVWVGRADGAPRTGVTGRDIALPILFEMADRAAHHLRDDGDSELRLSAAPLTPSKGALRAFSTDRPPEILFPPQGAELWAGTVDGRAPRPFVLAGRGAGALSWFIDGQPASLDDAGAPVWRPDQPGFYLVTAVDGAGRSSRVRVRVLTEDPA
ncbi:penicillin-binding protein 1C [Hyphomonas polymorpha PS728]|uniref:peptidoglycan glycosyltransferase n=1 Tax=Hyphomonas polymorpha PS728 TaxID=1280954 RepID=A0A062VBD1_9PROT|nr:penicillin-binding protein 1C [Hyphomonas polymorpha]KCZ97545.1 penicillin-binding protein 1C [Hyphomonas polymorpha PS728]